MAHLPLAIAGWNARPASTWPPGGKIQWISSSTHRELAPAASKFESDEYSSSQGDRSQVVERPLFKSLLDRTVAARASNDRVLYSLQEYLRCHAIEQGLNRALNALARSLPQQQPLSQLVPVAIATRAFQSRNSLCFCSAIAISGLNAAQ